MPDLAPPLRNFTKDFFAPAIEAGAMTQKQAEFLTSGPFLMPLYSMIRDVRAGELTQEEVENGFLFVIAGDKFRLDGSLENGKILVAAGEAIGDAMVIQGSIAGGRSITLDRETIRQRAKDIDAVHWPRGVILGLICTDELRAWRMDIEATLPALATRAPRKIAIGPPALAKRRSALWEREFLEDQHALWSVRQLEELEAGGHRIFQGLIVPGGKMWTTPFRVPPDPNLKETEKAQMADTLRYLDQVLGVDREPLLREPPPGWEPVEPLAQETERAPDPEFEERSMEHLRRKLSRREQKLFELLVIEHQTIEQAARTLGIKPATARTMFHRIKQKASFIINKL